MLHINILCVGKIKEKFFKDAISEYLKRLQKYCIMNIIELPDRPLPSSLNESLSNQIISQESDQLLSKLKSTSYNIALDSRGKQYKSEEFADFIAKVQNNYSEITFIIGGSLGLSNTLKEKCNSMISFSKMTFPHQLMRVFLLEQIFRAFKICNNEKYHH